MWVVLLRVVRYHGEVNDEVWLTQSLPNLLVQEIRDDKDSLFMIHPIVFRLSGPGAAPAKSQLRTLLAMLGLQASRHPGLLPSRPTTLRFSSLLSFSLLGFLLSFIGFVGSFAKRRFGI